MADLHTLYSFGAPPADLNLLFDNLFEQVFPQVKKLITDRWKKGKTPTGDVIGFYRNNEYALFKNQLNPLAGFGSVDLTLSGQMGQKITFGFVDVAEYEIFSTVPYFSDIITKFGDYNFNVTDEERLKIFGEIATKITEITFNKIYNG